MFNHIRKGESQCAILEGLLAGKRFRIRSSLVVGGCFATSRVVGLCLRISRSRKMGSRWRSSSDSRSTISSVDVRQLRSLSFGSVFRSDGKKPSPNSIGEGPVRGRYKPRKRHQQKEPSVDRESRPALCLFRPAIMPPPQTFSLFLLEFGR